MLRFTQAQQAYLLANRRAFNANQARLENAAGAALVGNAYAIPRQVWGLWDREAVEIQREVLAVFSDLSTDLSTPVPIGKLVHYFQTVSDSGEASISLDGKPKSRTDQQVYDYHGTPLPILDSVFGYGWRAVAAAQSEGFQLDATGRMNSYHKIATALEDIALDGSSKIVVGGAQLYGLRNHPKRNTRTTGVTLNGATGAQWLAEFKTTLEKLHQKNFRVPATIYVNWDDWFYAQNTDFSATYGNKTIAQRILEMGGVGRVVPASRVSANELIGVVKSKQVVQVLNGMPMSTTARNRSDPTDDYDFLVLAASAVEVKYDAENQCGVVHSASA